MMVFDIKQVWVPWKPLASTTPPALGSDATAALIFAHASAPLCASAMTMLLSVVNVPAFGATFPIAGGEARFPLPPPHPVQVPFTVRLLTVALRDESTTVVPPTW